MSSKSDSYYFNTFAECASLACEAAEVLHSVLTKFKSEEIDDIMRELHEVEHKADEKKHDMLSALLKAFITPIERDDIMNLSQAIDDITDSVEDVVIQINMDQVKSIRPDSIEFSELLIRCCQKVKSIPYPCLFILYHPFSFPNCSSHSSLGIAITDFTP